jgi:CDGSH-type Zn-finger protein
MHPDSVGDPGYNSGGLDVKPAPKFSQALAGHCSPSRSDRDGGVNSDVKREHLGISDGGRMPSTKIIVRNDGPLRVEGEIELVDMQGQAYGLAGRTAIALCRCGHSANKPFCDGSHKAAGFQDQQQARELPPPKPQI